MKRVAVPIAGALACITIQTQTPVVTHPHPRGYVAYRTTSAVTVDGRLDDPAWAQAAWTEDFVDIEGDAKPRPTWPTHVKMLWDDRFFYVGAELREPHVWATLKDHDSVIFHDNDFEVFIEPGRDNRAYYEFEINALGTYWDLLLPKPYRDGGHAVNSWEIPGLKSAVNVNGTLNDSRDTDRSWTVELAFPWAVLKEHASAPAPPRDGDQWRVNFSRVEWRVEPAQTGYKKVDGVKEDNWVWSPQGAVDMHQPEMWGYVQFSTSSSRAVPFVADPSWPARAWLHDGYYAQRTFREHHGRYAQTLAELGLPVPPSSVLGDAEMTSDDAARYTLSIVMEPRGGRRVRWFVNQESAVWSRSADR
jgi:cellulose/xylan binding protein with CBM9 domain